MKYLSDNLLAIALAIVMGISPLQTITASVTNCMDLNKTMHNQMNSSKMIMSSNMSKTHNQHDCCDKNSCDMTHCANTIAAVVTSVSLNEMTYKISDVHLKPSIALISFYPTSLYRPPKV